MTTKLDQGALSDALLDTDKTLGSFNDALQVAHSILRLLEGKMSDEDLAGARLLAEMLHRQLIALGTHGATIASRVPGRSR